MVWFFYNLETLIPKVKVPWYSAIMLIILCCLEDAFAMPTPCFFSLTLNVPVRVKRSKSVEKMCRSCFFKGANHSLVFANRQHSITLILIPKNETILLIQGKWSPQSDGFSKEDVLPDLKAFRKFDGSWINVPPLEPNIHITCSLDNTSIYTFKLKNTLSLINMFLFISLRGWCLFTLASFFLVFQHKIEENRILYVLHTYIFMKILVLYNLGTQHNHTYDEKHLLY